MKRLLVYISLSFVLAFIVTTGSYEINAYRHAGPSVSDGSGPVPPFPKSPVTLLADGSGPVPPFPKPPVMLLADGSGPVPPFPKPPANTSV